MRETGWYVIIEYEDGSSEELGPFPSDSVAKERTRNYGLLDDFQSWTLYYHYNPPQATQGRVLKIDYTVPENTEYQTKPLRRGLPAWGFLVVSVPGTEPVRLILGVEGGNRNRIHSGWTTIKPDEPMEFGKAQIRKIYINGADGEVRVRFWWS